MTTTAAADERLDWLRTALPDGWIDAIDRDDEDGFGAADPSVAVGSVTVVLGERPGEVVPQRSRARATRRWCARRSRPWTRAPVT